MIAVSLEMSDEPFLRGSQQTLPSQGYSIQLDSFSRLRQLSQILRQLKRHHPILLSKIIHYRRAHILLSAKPTATLGAIAPKVVVERTKTLACTRLQRIKQHDYKKGTIYIGTSMVSLSFLKSLV